MHKRLLSDLMTISSMKSGNCAAQAKKAEKMSVFPFFKLIFHEKALLLLNCRCKKGVKMSKIPYCNLKHPAKKMS